MRSLVRWLDRTGLLWEPEGQEIAELLTEHESCGQQHKRYAARVPLRMWAIVAKDEDDRFRVKDVKAHTGEEAVEEYQKIFSYEVVGYGMLGGSGHKFTWVNELER